VRPDVVDQRLELGTLDHREDVSQRMELDH
jgi:hypothetical protein